MDRREFLISSGATAIAGNALLGCKDDPAPRPPPLPTTSSAWKDIKDEFGLAKDLVHMSGFFLASHPRLVRDAIEHHRRGLDDNPFEYVESHVAELETAVRTAAAEYLGADRDDIALTDSTTMGLGVLYGGLRLEPGQEILSTTHDHIVTTMACMHRAARGSATFRQVSLYDDPAAATSAVIVHRLASAIRPETRVLALTWVHSGTGVKLPIRAIADWIATINKSRAEGSRVLLCVDGVHGFGVDAVTMSDLACDFFVAGCHKWLFGPRGTGLIWGKRAAWPMTSPAIPSMDPMWRSGDPAKIPLAGAMTPGGFHSFEHRWALESAFRFHLALGKTRVEARIHELNRLLKQELSRMPRVQVVTPLSDELSAGIVCFSVAGIEPAVVVSRLRNASIIASVTPPFYKPTYARLSAGLITVEKDIERALAAVRAL
jgi:selenocysteine lyase/cysteine desulfurase